MKLTEGGHRLLNRVCLTLTHRRRAVAAVLLALHLALGALYSIAVPPWEAHDEWAHYKFVEYVARHRALPPPGERLTNEYEFDEASQPPLYYILAALPVMLVDTDDGLTPQVNPYFNVDTGGGGINAAIHHPDQEGFPPRGTLLGLYLARGMSLLISLLGLVATYKLGRLLAPGRPLVALTALAIAALSPQYLFISSVVSNDVLIAALGCTVAWFGAQTALQGLRPKPALALAAATGLALVTKLSALALLPFVALAFLVGTIRALRRGASRRATWTTIGGAAAGGVALAGLWLWRNFRLTGMVLPRDPWVLLRLSQRWIERSDAVAPFSWSVVPGALRYAFRTFWASFGWGNLDAYPWVYWLFAGLCLIGLLGLILWWIGRGARWEHKQLAGLLALLIGAVVFMAAYRDFDYGSTLIRGRYLLPALGAVAVLIATGWEALLNRLARRGDSAVATLLIVLGPVLVLLNVLLPWRVITPAYAPPPMIATGTQLGQAVDLLPGEQPLNARFLAASGDPAAELIAYELWPDVVRPGEALGVALVWRVLRPLEHNYTLAVHLLDAGLTKVGEANVYPGRGNYATTLWRPGDVYREIYWVPVQRAVPEPVLGRVKVALFVDSTAQADPAMVGVHLPVTNAQGEPLGEAVLFGRFKLATADQPAEPQPGPGLATLGDVIRLSAAAVRTEPAPVVAGEVLTVTLTWDALGRPAADYQVFVHLEGAEGAVAYGDGPPAGGRYPTDLWARGERVEDAHEVRVPAETPAGAYRLMVGLYDAAGNRVAASSPSGDRLAADAIPLGEVTVLRRDRRNFVPWVIASATPGSEDKEP